MSTIAEDIDRANLLQARIDRDKAELKVLTDKIVGFALENDQDHLPLEDAERDGTQFLAIGNEIQVPIIFTADGIIGSFQRGSQKHIAIAAALPGTMAITPFYKSVSSLECVTDDGKKFRRIVREHMEPTAAAAFIDACLQRNNDGTPKNKSVIDWDRAQPIHAEEAAAS